MLHTLKIWEWPGDEASIDIGHFQGRTEVYGSCSELVAMGIDPTELLGLITHKEEEEEKDQFLIKEDDPEPDDEGVCINTSIVMGIHTLIIL